MKPNYIRAIILFLKLVGDLHFTTERKTFWQWIYEDRVGPKTAWSVAKLIWIDGIK